MRVAIGEKLMALLLRVWANAQGEARVAHHDIDPAIRLLPTADLVLIERHHRDRHGGCTSLTAASGIGASPF
jgi:hypothetical protein